MTAFIATTATGDIPTGTHRPTRPIFAVGALLFVMTLVMNMISHPAGPQVPRGLRMMARRDDPADRPRVASPSPALGR